MTYTPTTSDAAITGSTILYYGSPPIVLLPPYKVEPSRSPHAYSRGAENWTFAPRHHPVLVETMKHNEEILRRIELDDPVYVPEDADLKVSKECIQWCQNHLENISMLLLPRKTQIPDPNFYATSDGEIKIQWCGENDSLTLLINWEDSQAEFYHSDLSNDTAVSEIISLDHSELWDLLRIKVASVFCA